MASDIKDIAVLGNVTSCGAVTDISEEPVLTSIARLHSRTTKYTTTFIVTSMRTSNLNKYYMSLVGPD
jgi:hypothetical protein